MSVGLVDLQRFFARAPHPGMVGIIPLAPEALWRLWLIHSNIASKLKQTLSTQ